MASSGTNGGVTMARRCANPASPSPAPGGGRGAFTLVELLVVVAIIAVLVAMLLPAIGLLRERSRTATARTALAAVAMAIGNYVAEDARHFFPTPQGGDLLRYDEADAWSNLRQLAAVGFEVRPSQLDGDAGSASRGALLDPWGRPYRYRPDGPFRTAAGSDGTRMNGTADRPATPDPLDWNPKGIEPFAYLWSLGRPSAIPADDALPASVARWHYQRGAP